MAARLARLHQRMVNAFQIVELLHGDQQATLLQLHHQNAVLGEIDALNAFIGYPDAAVKQPVALHQQNWAAQPEEPESEKEQHHQQGGGELRSLMRHIIPE